MEVKNSRGDNMNTSSNITTDNIIFYESNRKRIINQLKQQHGLKLNDLIFLYHLYKEDASEIPLCRIKESIDFSLMEIHKTLTSITEKHIVGKIRSSEDERKVFITITPEQRQKINVIIDDFKRIHKDILDTNT